MRTSKFLAVLLIGLSALCGQFALANSESILVFKTMNFSQKPRVGQLTEVHLQNDGQVVGYYLESIQQITQGIENKATIATLAPEKTKRIAEAIDRLTDVEIITENPEAPACLGCSETTYFAVKTNKEAVSLGGMKSGKSQITNNSSAESLRELLKILVQLEKSRF